MGEVIGWMAEGGLVTYERVSHETERRQLGRLPSGRPVTTTVHRYEGGPGPRVHLQAGQHGIELNGPVALRRLHATLVDAEIAGTVVSVPVGNPIAFDHRSYLTPAGFDARNPNLNRVWPGDPEGSFQERLAAAYWPLVREADVLIDLHTGGADMLEHVRFDSDDEEARALAEAFGTAVLVADPHEPERDPTAVESGKLRAVAAAAGITGLTVELGNSRTVDPSATAAGVDGIRNCLRALDVLAERPPAPPEQTLLRDEATDTVADTAGLFEPHQDLAVGDEVGAGDELGVVYRPDTFERRETVTAVDGGLVYSLTREAVVMAGERLAGVAARRE